MRLLAEIIIIAALISLGWNKPFKELVAQAILGERHVLGADHGAAGEIGVPRLHVEHNQNSASLRDGEKNAFNSFSPLHRT